MTSSEVAGGRGSTGPATGAPAYRERLTPPPGWWALLAVGVVSAAAAAGVYLGPVWALTAGLACLLVFGGLLWSAAIVVQVDRRGLRVGRAQIEHRYLAASRSLDKAATTRRTGPEADARAYLVLRPYIPTAVEVQLDDADDPVPYWLVSSRHPERLRAALVEAAPGTTGSAKVTG